MIAHHSIQHNNPRKILLKPFVRMNNYLLRLALCLLLLFFTTPVPDGLAQARVLRAGIRVAVDAKIRTLDPARATGRLAREIIGNTYDRLVEYDPGTPGGHYGLLAESWSVSEDQQTFTFRLRTNPKFRSGAEVTAHDAAFSLQRLVRMRKSTPLPFRMFGWTPKSMESLIQAPDPWTLVLKTTQPLAPSFVLNALTMPMASVVQRELVLTHEQKGDLGAKWLAQHHAGSGPFVWEAWSSKNFVITRNPAYWNGVAALEGVEFVQLEKPEARLQALQNGEVQVARGLGVEEVRALAKSDWVQHTIPRGAIYYLALNLENPHLRKGKVRQALRRLVDYQGLEKQLEGQVQVHPGFVPSGLLGALPPKGFGRDVARARQLLADAKLRKGFSLRLDADRDFPFQTMARSIKEAFAQAKVSVKLVLDSGRNTLVRYKARQHDLYLGVWYPDFPDPQNNAVAFGYNPASDSQPRSLSYRNNWATPEKWSQRVLEGIRLADVGQRRQHYEALQREHQALSPFIILFESAETLAHASEVSGLVFGTRPEHTLYQFAYHP